MNSTAIGDHSTGPMNEFQLRDEGSKWDGAAELLFFGAICQHDVGDPVFKDERLLRVQGFDFEAHPEGRMGVDDLRFRVNAALVARAFDGQGGADAERRQGVHIAATETDFGRSRHKLGPSTYVEDLNRGDKRAP